LASFKYLIMIEQASYEVIRKIGEIEIRRYTPLIFARVDEYGDGGFNILFKLITGSNLQKSNTYMTANLSVR
jgi:hypothetical protein